MVLIFNRHFPLFYCFSSDHCSSAKMFSFIKVVTLLSLFLSPTFANVLPPEHRHSVTPRQEPNHWVSAWTSMPQLVEPDNLPPSPYVSLILSACYYLSAHLHIKIRKQAILSSSTQRFGKPSSFPQTQKVFVSNSLIPSVAQITP